MQRLQLQVRHGAGLSHGRHRAWTDGRRASTKEEYATTAAAAPATAVFDATGRKRDRCYKVYVGGRWGKKVRMGTPLNHLFTREEVIRVVEKAILLFKCKGISGERFGETVDRLGADKVEKMLVSDNLLKRKEEILEIETVAGAKC